MRQDRRLNGWVLIGSIFSILFAVALIAAAGALGVFGFMYTNKLLKLDDLQFFVNQEGLIKFQQFIANKGTAILQPKYLYLILAGIVGVVGLLALIFAIISLSHAKKRSVVRHRVSLFIFNLVNLAIVGCATTYLVMEFDVITDNIKYVLYGLIGAFGFVALCKLFGIIFGRSEKFMSNDNNKYKFGAASMRNSRVEANNASAQEYKPQQANIAAPQGDRPAPRPAAARPVQPAQPAARPMAPTGTRPAPRPMPRPGVARPAQPGQRPAATAARPVRPMGPTATAARPAQRPTVARAGKYCPKCGKTLAPEEKICGLCGYKVSE